VLVAPGGEHAAEDDHGGEQDHQHRDPVHAEVVFDAELVEPGVALDVPERRGAGGAGRADALESIEDEVDRERNVDAGGDEGDLLDRLEPLGGQQHDDAHGHEGHGGDQRQDAHAPP
jgi:hypothetical protein